MYSPMKSLLMRILRVPPEPDPPSGSDGSLQVFRAAPGYYRYRIITWLIGQGVLWMTLAGCGFGMGLGALAEAQGEGGEPGAWILVGLVVLGALALLVQTLFSYATLRLDYELRWYKVTDRSLRIREGVVHVREMTMTFANIQNLSISQGPIQRMFNIADLLVETAGGGGMAAADAQQHQAMSMHVGVFRGVDNAQEIRDLMMARLKRLKDAGLGDSDDPHHHDDDDEASDADVLEALRAVRDEAAAMRRALNP